MGARQAKRAVLPWCTAGGTGDSPVELELQLSAELDIAIAARAGDVAERRCVDGRGWVAEVRMVEQGERLEPDLEPQSLLNRKILEHREIHGLRARAMKQVAASVPISEVGGRNRIQIRDCERRRVNAAD